MEEPIDAPSCNFRQFGDSCSVPLGPNCPWRKRGATPNFMEISTDGRVYRRGTSSDVPTLVEGLDYYKFAVYAPDEAVYASMEQWIDNTRSQGPITQIIFGFPPETWRRLTTLIEQNWYQERIAFKLTEGLFNKPGTVMELGDKIPELLTQLSEPDEEITSRAGNVFGYTGYYLYLARWTNWRVGQEFYIPKVIVDLMPRVPGDPASVEYSFYGSEDYCYMNRVSGLPPPM